MNSILEVRGLCKAYRDFKLKDVSLNLPEGYVMGFIGPNGAGKTTTIKSILGIVHPDAGQVRLLNGVPGQIAADEVGVVMDTPFYAEDWNTTDVESALKPFIGIGTAKSIRRCLRISEFPATARYRNCPEA